jgi:hypothetical protein
VQAESVQDLELSARRRLDEAAALPIDGQHHSSIYLAGLSAEMLLKTACFFVDKAKPADPVAPLLGPMKKKGNLPPFKADYESGHGLWFWSQELLERRRTAALAGWSRRLHRRFLEVCASLYADWFIGMRYRPGAASQSEAAAFFGNVEWLANNHASLRS